jgi:hypothetical protein
MMTPIALTSLSLFFPMLLIGDIFSFATPFCACIFNKHSNALHFILEPGRFMLFTRNMITEKGH